MTSEHEYDYFVSVFSRFCQVGTLLEKEVNPLKAKVLKIEYNNLLCTLKMDKIEER